MCLLGTNSCGRLWLRLFVCSHMFGVQRFPVNQRVSFLRNLILLFCESQFQLKAVRLKSWGFRTLRMEDELTRGNALEPRLQQSDVASR